MDTLNAFAVGLLVLVAVLLVLLIPWNIYRIKVNTDHMRRDLARLADDAEAALHPSETANRR